MKFFLGILPILSSGAAMALEQPNCTVIESANDFELREYEPCLVAEVTVEASLRKSDNIAFRIRAGYIFGGNRSSTAMNMTAPVETAADGDNGYIYGFVMESRYTMDALPLPLDERIRIREVPARTVAALSFSGLWTNGNYQRHESELLDRVSDRNLQTVGEPVFARYNGPMTPFFMRRNEVMVEVVPAAAESTRRRCRSLQPLEQELLEHSFR